jgi:hypothetical protein
MDANAWRKLPLLILIGSLLLFGFFPRLLTGKVEPVTKQIVTMANAPRGATTVRSSATPFPLTPALSLGERENPFPSFGETGRGNLQSAAEIKKSAESLFPLPEGEGQGEGEAGVVQNRHQNSPSAGLNQK